MTEREQYVLRLAQMAFEADVKHMAQVKGISPDDCLDWTYHVGARTPLVARYRAIALAVEDAMYKDARTLFGRRRHFAREDDDRG